MKLSIPHLLTSTVLSILILSAGCSGRDPAGLDVAQAPVNPLVFDDDYSSDVYFQAFLGTDLTAVSIDSVYAYNGYAPDGAKSLRFSIPPQGSALGIYTGGVLTAGASRDFTEFNALTFYARSNAEVSLDVIGFGNDNTGGSLYEAGRGGLPLTADWTFMIVPIPAPSKLIAERGLLTFAEALEQQPPNSGIYPYPEGYNIWLDQIEYAQLDNINFFRSSMRSVNQQYFVGSTVPVENTSTIFDVDGAFVVVDHSSGYFDYSSTDPSVAAMQQGRIKIVGVGQAVVTATNEGRPVNGTLTLTGAPAPPEAAPTPTLPASDVISMFSASYNDVPVDTWRAPWGGSTAVLSSYEVAGSVNRMYSSLNFVGIVFETSKIDATQMTHFHMDVYAPVGTTFRVKLVSFPPQLTSGVQTGDLILTATSTPAFNAGSWSSLDIPLGDFVLPPDWDWTQVGQLVLSTTDAQLALVNNVYWHK